MKTKRAACLSLVMLFLLPSVLAAVLVCGNTWAFYPEKPITLLIGFDVAGTVDLTARALASEAEKILGQPVVVENRGGGGGSVALSLLANAKPDGYTLCVATSSGLVRGPLLQKVPYKPLKSFSYIMGYCTPESGLIVKGDSPWKDLREFLAYAKANPNKIKYGSNGISTAMYHAMLVIEKQENIKWVHMPYKGAMQAMPALLGGHIEAVTVSTGDFTSHIQSGMVRLLATHGEKRMKEFPDVPTLKELGYNFVNETVFAVYGPAGLPPEVVKKLDTAFEKAMDKKEFKDLCFRLGLTPVYYSSEAYEEYVKTGWGKIEKMMIESALIKEPATQPY